MASFRDMSRYEGLSINHVPFFNGSEYVYWKTIMMVFLKYEATEVWDAIETSPYIPKKTVDGVETLKTKA